MKVIFIY